MGGLTMQVCSRRRHLYATPLPSQPIQTQSARLATMLQRPSRAVSPAPRHPHPTLGGPHRLQPSPRATEWSAQSVRRPTTEPSGSSAAGSQLPRTPAPLDLPPAPPRFLGSDRRCTLPDSSKCAGGIASRYLLGMAQWAVDHSCWSPHPPGASTRR